MLQKRCNAKGDKAAFPETVKFTLLPESTHDRRRIRWQLSISTIELYLWLSKKSFLLLLHILNNCYCIALEYMHTFSPFLYFEPAFATDKTAHVSNSQNTAMITLSSERERARCDAKKYSKLSYRKASYSQDADLLRSTKYWMYTHTNCHQKMLHKVNLRF